MSIHRLAKIHQYRRGAATGATLCFLLLFGGLVAAVIDARQRGEFTTVIAIFVFLGVMGGAIAVGLSLPLLSAISLRDCRDARLEHDHPVMVEWRREAAATKAESAAAWEAWQKAMDEIRAESELSRNVAAESPSLPGVDFEPDTHMKLRYWFGADENIESGYYVDAV